jgi:hypothetical protein
VPVGVNFATDSPIAQLPTFIEDHVVNKTHLCILVNRGIDNSSYNTALTAEDTEKSVLEDVCFI